MSDDALLELVSAASDGELDRRQLAEVERRLRDSAAARRLLADLERLDTLMSSLPERALPDTLHARIVDAADALIRKPAPPRAFRFPNLALGYGLAAAAGIVLTIAVYQVEPFVPDASDHRNLTGTMVPGEIRVLDRDTTQLAEVTGRVELQQRKGELWLDIRVDAAREIDLTIDFAAAGLRPVGIAQPRMPFESVEIADGLLRARGVGRHEMSVSLRRREDAAVADGAAIELEYSSHGGVLKQGSLSSTVD